MPHVTRDRIPLSPATVDRFRTKFVRGHKDECWLWRSRKTDGYGSLTIGGTSYLAHRISYQLYKGKIPPGKLILHKCHCRACVNPNHLYAGTNQDNMSDMVAAGRAKGGHQFGEKHPCAKLTDTEAKQLIALRHKGTPYLVLAAKFGISRGHASDIVRGVRRKDNKCPAQ